MKLPKLELTFTISARRLSAMRNLVEKYGLYMVSAALFELSLVAYLLFYRNGLGLAYNDARSHLDIGRRVVEGLNPGLAQLGSVWLPLPHVLMIPTIWSDLMWHSGLAGAVQSMIAFVLTGLLLYLLLHRLDVGIFGRVFAVAIFASNLNILYLQSTAMTELLLVATMTFSAYYLMLWYKDSNLLCLLKAAFFIMLTTLVRYDGWFLLLTSALLIFLQTLRRKGYKQAEGLLVLFGTLAAFGVGLWFLWNLLIFGDPLYFALGPFSAYAQQTQLSQAGDLLTKGNLLLSIQIYLYALLYNVYTLPAFFGLAGAFLLWTDKRLNPEVRVASLTLLSPLFFNILALFLGHSVLFIQGFSGNSWFNVRYGMMAIPSLAIFSGFLVDRLKSYRALFVGLFAFVSLFAIYNGDAVTIDDARVGSSQKNVSEVSSWLRANAGNKEGFILISAASHDAIIFSSGLPMKRFIHEGTGSYWKEATLLPDRWARWIVLRTYDDNDLTYKLIKQTLGFQRFELVDSYPFADIYELKEEYLSTLLTKPILTESAELSDNERSSFVNF